jgi:dihydropteroate synthase
MAALPKALEGPRTWSVGGRLLDLSRPLIMGVVNVTPDSFSDGGRFLDSQAARAHAERLIEEGADLIDIGGESTRPGAADVSVVDEIDRVVPVIETIAARGVPVSVDTSKPEVMRAALAAGAAIVNDVRALREPGAIEAVRESGCGVVVMHMKGTPRTMQQSPAYDDVVREVAAFLQQRIDELERSGIDVRRIAIDPGFGFGKSAEHNFTLLRDLRSLARTGLPLVVGLSRKSMLGKVTGRPVDERVVASVAAALMAVERGADIVRVHDVAATRDALSVWQATQLAKEPA